MRKWVVLTLGLLVGLSLSAAPLCTNQLGSNVLTPGFECQVANLVFSNFSAQNAGNVPSPAVYLVNAGIYGNSAFLNFNPMMGNSQVEQDIHFWFKVTGAHQGADLHVGGSGASINEIVCSGPFGAWNQCTGTILANLVASSGQFVVGYYNASQAWIFKDIYHAKGGHLTDFTETFVIIPEPVTLLLIGSGLLGLGLLRRRWPKA